MGAYAVLYHSKHDPGKCTQQGDFLESPFSALDPWSRGPRVSPVANTTCHLRLCIFAHCVLLKWHIPNARVTLVFLITLDPSMSHLPSTAFLLLLAFGRTGLAASQVALYTDADCRDLASNVTASNGYPDGECTGVWQQVSENAQSFQFLSLDTGCSGQYESVRGGGAFLDCVA